jgi:hypothetical protein
MLHALESGKNVSDLVFEKPYKSGVHPLTGSNASLSVLFRRFLAEVLGAVVEIEGLSHS